MTNEEKRRAIRESKELLERLRDKSSAPEPAQPEPEVEVRFPDPLTAWRSWHAERDAERKAAKLARQYAERREREQQHQVVQQNVSRDELNTRLEAERKYHADVLTQVAADLYARIGRLEKDTARPTEDVKVIDLPSSFLRRVN